VLVLGTYQYLEIYFALAGLIIILPFILGYFAVKEIRKWKAKAAESVLLEGKEYRAKGNEGEELCHICIDQYKEGETIVALPCNQRHHFHQQCLAEWIKVSHTCPICRMQIVAN
jgi:hypothetical protein